MDRVAEIANLAGRPKLTLSCWSPTEPWVHTAWRRGTEAARSFGRLVHQDDERLALLLAVKAALIAADSAASAMFREDRRLEEWLDEVIRVKAIVD